MLDYSIREQSIDVAQPVFPTGGAAFVVSRGNYRNVAFNGEIHQRIRESRHPQYVQPATEGANYEPHPRITAQHQAGETFSEVKHKSNVIQNKSRPDLCAGVLSARIDRHILICRCSKPFDYNSGVTAG